jgi:hypothetical protein
MGSKSAAPPPPPDYTKIAHEQAGLDKAALEQQTQANRPDQFTPTGSVTWSQDPATGRWTQTERYTPEAEAALKAQQQAQQGLAGAGLGMLEGVKGAMDQPLDMSGMTGVKGFNPAQLPGMAGIPGYGRVDPSQLGEFGSLDYSKLGEMPEAGFGAVQEVQDAMMSRLRPDLERRRASETQRLKAQGITEGSRPWQTSMGTLGEGENDASQQALLGGMGAYGDIFNRGMAVRQQGGREMESAADFANALRRQKFGEQETMADMQTGEREGMMSERQRDYDMENARQMMERGASEDDRNRQIREALMMRQMPLNEFNAFMSGSQVENPSFENFTNSGLAQAADISGAARDSYQAAVAAANAKRAAKSGKMAGLGSLAGTGIGAMFGGPLGASIGGSLGGKIGGGF